MRGAMCVVVRDLIVYGVLTDLMKGRPAVYATFSTELYSEPLSTIGLSLIIYGISVLLAISLAPIFGELRRFGLGFGGTLRAAAARDPDRVALVDESTVRTYAQLLADAERLAAGAPPA